MKYKDERHRVEQNRSIVTIEKFSFQNTTVSCKMRQTAPRREQLNRVQWFNDRRNGKDIFRLRMPKISERNGKICCLRVIVVRMQEGQGHDQLPDQEILQISSYKKVHESGDAARPWGAYIAEILGPNFMGRDVYVGDGQNIVSTNVGSGCPACQSGAQAHLLRAEKSAHSLRFIR
jgi:protein-tyrosine phosphatase